MNESGNAAERFFALEWARPASVRFEHGPLAGPLLVPSPPFETYDPMASAGEVMRDLTELYSPRKAVPGSGAWWKHRREKHQRFAERWGMLGIGFGEPAGEGCSRPVVPIDDWAFPEREECWNEGAGLLSFAHQLWFAREDRDGARVSVNDGLALHVGLGVSSDGSLRGKPRSLLGVAWLELARQIGCRVDAGSCSHCGLPLVLSVTGRSRRRCGDACRQAAYRVRDSVSQSFKAEANADEAAAKAGTTAERAQDVYRVLSAIPRLESLYLKDRLGELHIVDRLSIELTTAEGRSMLENVVREWFKENVDSGRVSWFC